MTKRDFFRLPIGEYKATDGIYNYKITKYRSESKEVFYSVKFKDQVMTMWEEMKYILPSTKFPVKKISAGVSIGGIIVAGGVSMTSINRLHIVSPDETNLRDYLKKQFSK